MAGFSDLPDELVLIIVAPFLEARNMARLWRPGRSNLRSEYYQDERRKVIANLSTTCRGMRRLLGGYVNEFIYLDGTFPRTIRLLRAVSGNPAAFRSTSKYLVQIVSSNPIALERGFNDPENLVCIRKAALDAGLGDELDRISSGRLRGDLFHLCKVYFLLLLILRRLVNVQSIALPEFMLDSLRLLDLNKLSLELHSLRSIDLLSHHGTTHQNRVTFIPARIRHKINDLRVHLPRASHGFELDVLPFPMLKSLSVKGISGFDGCYASLEKALAGLEHLETFACDEYLFDTSAEPDEIVGMLAKHNSKTLTKLILADLAATDNEAKMRLSFRGLPNLTDLYLDMDTLIGAMGELEFGLWAHKPQGTRHDDQLQSLRRLHVSRPVGWRAEGKLRWLEQTVAAGSFPCLRELTVDSFDGLKPDRADVMRAGVVVYKASLVRPGEW